LRKDVAAGNSLKEAQKEWNNKMRKKQTGLVEHDGHVYNFRAQWRRPVVVRDGDWLIDLLTNNRAQISFFGSEGTASATLRGLIDCTNCTNCRYCIGCDRCVDCNGCTACTNCTGLVWEGGGSSKHGREPPRLKLMNVIKELSDAIDKGAFSEDTDLRVRLIKGIEMLKSL